MLVLPQSCCCLLSSVQGADNLYALQTAYKLVVEQLRVRARDLGNLTHDLQPHYELWASLLSVLFQLFDAAQHCQEEAAGAAYLVRRLGAQQRHKRSPRSVCCACRPASCLPPVWLQASCCQAARAPS